MTILIFANGELDNVEWIRPYLAEAAAVIAADGGTRHLFRLQQAPDVVIGDMDSLLPELTGWLEAKGTYFITHPAAKNETDLELALLYAVETYDDPLLIFGALGGRLDQMLANILLLAHPGLHGRRVELVTTQERAWLVKDGTEIQGKVGDIISLIPLAGDVQVRATTGLQWSLHNEVLAFGLARGVSNVMTADTATISLHSGQLFCIHTIS